MNASIGLLNDRAAVRQLELDDVKLTYVVDGVISLLPDVFFPNIPAAYWDEHPEALNTDGHVYMSAGGLLVERGGHRLLIDAGLGPVISKTPSGFVRCGAFLDTLAALGCSPDDVDVLALTHIHMDHTGWTFTALMDGSRRATFPNATYALAETEWEPHSRGDHPPGTPDLETVVIPLGIFSTRFHDGAQVAPGVITVVTPGHSAGHTSYVVTTSAGQRVVAFGDVFHVPAQLAHPRWASAPDTDAEGVAVARERILRELEEPFTLGFGIHFGDQPFGKITRGSTGEPTWTPVATLAVLPAPQLLAKSLDRALNDRA
jgi:glyoxylase-like metal-dependent hydrolase (beta-lactamase superfamily II)